MVLTMIEKILVWRTEKTHIKCSMVEMMSRMAKLRNQKMKKNPSQNPNLNLRRKSRVDRESMICQSSKRNSKNPENGHGNLLKVPNQLRQKAAEPRNHLFWRKNLRSSKRNALRREIAVRLIPPRLLVLRPASRRRQRFPPQWLPK
jgi:hypothetical protein